MRLQFVTIPLAAISLAFICLSCAKKAENNSSTGPEAPPAATVCTAPGWASQNGGTTGGGSATATVVSTYATLKAAIENKSVKVIQVSGSITIPSGGRISFQDQSGKTLFGVPGARLVSEDQTQNNSGIIYMKRCSNIIIRNLVFEGAGAYDVDGQDNMTIDNCSNVWLDHCEFQDGVDGNLDFKNMSDYITATYCKFSYLKAPRAGGSGGSNDHRFSNLIGSSDDATGDRGHLRISFIRCWWAPGCVARMPRVRFGKVHVVNSYFNSTVSSSCVQAGFEADILVEANVFENVKRPIDLMSNNSTAVQEKNNIFISVTGNTAGNGVNAFAPPYTLNTLDNSAVKAAVTGSTGAGATLTGNSCTNL
ncbi:pectate lyase family protein [Filimonas effusa]|uniref:Pectate lyase n=1 Tax=Filimonas effusa TaxID=2508721 RepID=A0A4Q1D8S8_9BACT|nr:pectate lyase-like adhesive domain-containing protein [Filimonas effusa]RXK85701.1 pectate lyase [Filimonas effusa]